MALRLPSPTRAKCLSASGRVAQTAQRDEAREEFRLAPRLARLADAVPGGHGVGRARIAQPQQLPRQHLPLAPEHARGLRRRTRRDLPGRRRLRVALAPTQPARALEGEARIAARRLGPRLRIGIGPVGGVVEARRGDALPRRIEKRQGPCRRARLPRQRQPVEAPPVLVRSKMRAVAPQEARLRQRVAGRLRPTQAQHLHRLRLLAGASQRFGEPLVSLQGARRARGEPLHGQRVARIVRQRLLGATGERVLRRPFRVRQGKGRNLRSRGAGVAGLQPHPQHQLADQRMRALRRHLRL